MLIRAAALVVLLATTAMAKPPELGDALPAEAELLEKPEASIPAQLRPSYQLVRDGTRFLLDIDKQQKIVFIWTDDPKFKTPEGVVVGAPMMGVLAAAHPPLNITPDWCYFIHLASGWNAGFVAYPGNPTGGPLHGNEKISFIFKSVLVK